MGDPFHMEKVEWEKQDGDSGACMKANSYDIKYNGLEIFLFVQKAKHH